MSQTPSIADLKAPVARISPDATITIEQKCADCDGRGHGDVRAHCRTCGHVFTVAEMEQECELDRLAWPGGTDTMLCGHDWRNRVEEDDCLHCEGTGYFRLVVTMRELAVALWRLQPDLAE